ncbi:hypothetical protein DFH06DRAFT_1131023 [Mycena polygramma]|nr:hypothetical protein DFH06DRAFT_1131023 [Mycena polygramma]
MVSRKIPTGKRFRGGREKELSDPSGIIGSIGTDSMAAARKCRLDGRIGIQGQASVKGNPENRKEPKYSEVAEKKNYQTHRGLSDPSGQIVWRPRENADLMAGLAYRDKPP